MIVISNNKISHLINSQVPFFVRNDHPNFVAFIEAYYRFLEQEEETINQIKLIKNNIDIDQSLEIFLEKFYNQYLKLIPNNILADKKLLVKHVKDFYLSRGTEKSIRFLMRILFNEEVSEFYYPKRDVLRASDGKWFIEKSIKVDNIRVDGISNTNLTVLSNFVNKTIRGNTSNATAVVERFDTYYDGGLLVNELKVSNQFKTFDSGEVIFATFEENGITKSLTANLFAGSINTINLVKSGTGYKIGDTLVVESNTGTGAVIIVSSVSSGNVKSIFALNGGAGYQANNFLLISGGGGTGAIARIESVQSGSIYHPNTYNIVSSIISLEANTPINNTVYSNLNSSNVNTAIANAVSYFTYANTGPIQTIQVIIGGDGYTSLPTVTAQANTVVRSLGILGRMEIVNGGEDYVIGDTIVFNNTPGGYGYGAIANVTNVNANGTITKINFYANTGEMVGGTGYNQNFLPTANVVTSTGSNANIVVVAVLGEGANLRSVTDSAGAIQSLSILSRGQGYQTAPTINLQSIGDGTAQVVATVVSGTFTYPGRYINDDGHVSGYNFLQDRDYYQDFSYVIKIGRSIEDYRKPLKELIHPAGMKVFGEYIRVDNGENINLQISIAQSGVEKYILYDDNVMTPANTTNLYNWILGAGIADCVVSLDTDELSPFGYTILKMEILGGTLDPHIGTYNSSTYNLAPASDGETWEARVWSRANLNTTMEIFGFSSLSNGYAINSTSDEFNVGPDWSEKVLTFNTVSGTQFVQVRLDGPNLETNNVALWFDALQVRKIS